MQKTKRGKSQTPLEQLKAQIDDQSKDQDQIIEFTIASIDIKTFTPDIAKLFNNYTNLISLEFIKCKITSLENFPNLPKLVQLGLDENQLTGTALIYIADHFPELTYLSLSWNKITSLEDCLPLNQLRHLKELDLSENPVANRPNYREIIMTQITPTLEILDSLDRAGDEVERSEDEDDEDEFDVAEMDDASDDEDYEEDDEEDDDDEPKPRKKTKK